METILILIGALAMDLLLGEPPAAVHPVVWVGKFTSLWEKGGAHANRAAQFIYGMIFTLLTVALFAIPTYFILFYLKNLNAIVYIIAAFVLLKSTFSLKELLRVAQYIKRLLLEKDLQTARFRLRSLVKRDARDLPEPLIVSAAVESVAENASDSFVAPLFYFLIFGVPGAMAYRVINTLDAMIGYHGKYEYLGKFAARLDDVANFIPARLTGILIVLAAFVSRANGRKAWKVLIGDHAKTESPNAGWPMSAAAGALNVQLEKVGHYKLGEPGVVLEPQTIDSSIRLIGVCSLLWTGMCVLVMFLVSG